MDSRWFSGIPQQEKAEFKNYLRNSTELFSKIKAILSNHMYKKELRNDYKEAGWPYLRAYDDGYNAAINDVKDLLTFKED